MKDNLIGKSIKVNRIAQNYTQKQLAQKIGVTHAAISYWENAIYPTSKIAGCLPMRWELR